MGMRIKRIKRKSFDGPSPFEDTSKHWVPMPYDGRLPNGRKTHVPENWIRIPIGDEIYWAEPLALAAMLAERGIHTGDQADWIQIESVVVWIKSNGILECRPQW